MAFLGDGIESKGQKTLGTPRCLKDLIEEELFERRRDLFTEVDLVFFDTTSLYFEGRGGESIGRRGHNKDHRPDLYQMVVGMALDVGGRPICCEMWPGNTADVKTLLPTAKRMRERFRLREITVVADRGMVSQATLVAFEKSDPPVRYIVGVRMRRQKEVNRMLSEFDDQSVAAQQAVNRDLVLERLQKEALHTVTSDFDGSVQSTKRHAE